MSREIHVRFREHLEGKFLRVTRLVILVKSQRAVQRVMGSITRYLEITLKLKVNLAKSKVAPMSECAFLGFTIKGKKIRWTDKVLADFKYRVKELTGRSWGVSMEYRLHKLGQYPIRQHLSQRRTSTPD